MNEQLDRPTFIFRPAFNNSHPVASADSAFSEKFNSLLNSWKVIFPESNESDTVDFQDWVENVVRFDSALTGYPNAEFFIIKNDQVFDLDGRQTGYPDDGIFLGVHCDRDSLYMPYIGNKADLIDNYAVTDTFKKFAGRDIVLCEQDCESSADLVDTLRQMVTDGHEKVFVKVNLPKYQVEVLDFNSGDFNDVFYNSNTALAAIHIEGLSDAFIVQEFKEMLFEYRMIVIDNEVVCGAGCIEEFTPLNNRGVFDYQLRENRRAVSCVVESKALVDRYVDVAHQFALEMAKENSEFSSYTLDLALTDDDQVIVVECNSLENYGLYAMNFDAVLGRMVGEFFKDEQGLVLGGMVA